MPKYIITVAERWAKYHEVEVEASDVWTAKDKAKEFLEEDSDVSYDAAVALGLEFSSLEVIETGEAE